MHLKGLCLSEGFKPAQYCCNKRFGLRRAEYITRHYMAHRIILQPLRQLMAHSNTAPARHDTFGLLGTDSLIRQIIGEQCGRSNT